jgi:transketolase N-terminal domain/subunit
VDSMSKSAANVLETSNDIQNMEDVGFMTCMTLVLMCNYAQTGHFGGPLAYTPFNVTTHLSGPDKGGLRYDYRRPKHPYSDKFMLAAGHCAPTCYALWMIMGEALQRKFKATGDRRYFVSDADAMLPIDALGFRRGAQALKPLLEKTGLADHPAFAQAKGRGIRALSGHIESTDVTNDVNGGPSGIGIAAAAGKAAFWDVAGAPVGSPKIVAFEGEFALCAGHAQELKTQALALKVGKRLRVFFSYNNAGIDDSLIGGVIDRKFDGYDLAGQWTSYGWNVLPLADGHDYNQIGRVLKLAEDWGSGGPATHDHFWEHDQGLLAVRGERQDPLRRSGDRPDRRLSEPSPRFQNERSVYRRAGTNVRKALRCQL